MKADWIASPLRRLLFSFILALLPAAALAALGPGAFGRGWLAAQLLLTLSAFALISAWRWAGGGKLLGWLVALAFVLRLGLGVGLSLALPVWGYDEEAQRAGYLFPDAFHRDRDAFNLAVSGERLLFNPEASLASDQYGGLGLTSAFLYRTLSPDAHRAWLVLIAGSLVFALGVPFLWLAVQPRLPRRAGLIAVWLFVLYPDGLFFTAAQMREPFMLGLSAAALWSVLTWRAHRRAALLAAALSAAGMLFFATRSALFVLGVLAILFWVDFTAARTGRAWTLLGWAGLALGCGFGAALTWEWFRWASIWDQVVTLRNSGMVSYLLDLVTDRFRIPFMIGYGLAQPVLPGAIAEPGIPLWKTIVLLRSLGWYAVAPLLLYAFFAVWREPEKSRRRLVLWAVIITLVWACVAALRAGADMTDNPRYRMAFLPFFALAVGWGVDWALARKDAWLLRWLAVEAVALGFFTQWYLSRYYKWWGRMEFFPMLVWIAALSGLILAGGLLWDAWQARKRRPA